MRIKVHLFSLNRTSMSLFALTCFLALGALQPARAQSFSSVERGRAHDMLNTLKDDIEKNYYDTKYHGVDVEARFKAADEKLKHATSLGQALGIIAQAMIDLDDSHTVFLPPPRPERIEYGWRMQMIGDKCYVIAVKPGTDAEAKGLKVGDIIESISGFRPTRKEYWKMEYYYYALSPRPELHIVAQSPDGESRPLDIAAKVKQGKRVIDPMANSGQDLWDMVRESEKADHMDRHRFYEVGSTVIWKMPNFEFEPAQVGSLMGRIKGHSTLVLDLRNNPGGYTETLKQMVGYFFDRDIKIADMKGRKEMKPMVAKSQGGNIFNGKLIVLVNSKSASCAELFARTIQLEKRGTVIGDRSAGAVMQARILNHSLGTDNIVPYAASITDADLIMSDGQSLEHTGVIPDELKLPTGAEMAAGQDTVLAYAAQLAGLNLSPDKAGTLFPFEWMP